MTAVLASCWPVYTMARPRRIYIPDTSVHVIQRGNNGGCIFADSRDNETFLRLLQLAIAHYDVAIHAFVLMSTHYHLLATPSDEDALPSVIQYVAGQYTKYYNRRHGRMGTLWNERYRGILVLNEAYWLTCLRYIDQNPVRAGMVVTPDAYRWSGYAFHAGDRNSVDWLTEHAVYTALGRTAEIRRAAYKAICGVSLTESELELHRHIKGQTLYV